MKYSFFPADILLPDFPEHEAYLWAVVACDQFTSEPEYWEAVAGKVGNKPSTLHMILPEVYLSEQADEAGTAVWGNLRDGDANLRESNIYTFQMVCRKYAYHVLSVFACCRTLL